jgi:pimeloyl-ACP methyl ester carboxylesterase
MAEDAVAFIRALGFDQVDLHGFSMGGMVAQVIAQDEPGLVRKLILTGTGPAGGKGMKEVVWVAQLDTLRGLLSFQDPKQFLFFSRTANGDNDRMLPTPNTLDMAERLPSNELVIYPDAGHGGIFQFHEDFVAKALDFLE